MNDCEEGGCAVRGSQHARLTCGGLRLGWAGAFNASSTAPARLPASQATQTCSQQLAGPALKPRQAQMSACKLASPLPPQVRISRPSTEVRLPYSGSSATPFGFCKGKQVKVGSCWKTGGHEQRRQQQRPSGRVAMPRMVGTGWASWALRHGAVWQQLDCQLDCGRTAAAAHIWVGFHQQHVGCKHGGQLLALQLQRLGMRSDGPPFASGNVRRQRWSVWQLLGGRTAAIVSDFKAAWCRWHCSHSILLPTSASPGAARPL